jgi:spermidine synthase
MDLWCTRRESQGTRYCVKVLRPLFSDEGKRGRIEVFETEDFGKALAIAGSLALTDTDGFAHREMLAHTPLNVHPNVRSVVVIGGGDGAVVHELLRYPEIERIVLVENDEVLMTAARRFFPELASSLDDLRVRIDGSDASGFVRDSKERFDLMIAEEPAALGREQAFYSDCFRLLSGDGILVGPSGSAFFPHRRRELLSVAARLKRLFPIYRLFRIEQPSLDSGGSFVGFASKRFDPVANFDPERLARRDISTRYYSADMHRAAFALAPYLAEALEGA